MFSRAYPFSNKQIVRYDAADIISLQMKIITIYHRIEPHGLLLFWKFSSVVSVVEAKTNIFFLFGLSYSPMATAY